MKVFDDDAKPRGLKESKDSPTPSEDEESNAENQMLLWERVREESQRCSVLPLEAQRPTVCFFVFLLFFITLFFASVILTADVHDKYLTRQAIRQTLLRAPFLEPLRADQSAASPPASQSSPSTPPSDNPLARAPSLSASPRRLSAAPPRPPPPSEVSAPRRHFLPSSAETPAERATIPALGWAGAAPRRRLSDENLRTLAAAAAERARGRSPSPRARPLPLEGNLSPHGGRRRVLPGSPSSAVVAESAGSRAHGSRHSSSSSSAGGNSFSSLFFSPPSNSRHSTTSTSDRSRSPSPRHASPSRSPSPPRLPHHSPVSSSESGVSGPSSVDLRSYSVGFGSSSSASPRAEPLSSSSPSSSSLSSSARSASLASSFSSLLGSSASSLSDYLSSSASPSSGFFSSSASPSSGFSSSSASSSSGFVSFSTSSFSSSSGGSRHPGSPSGELPAHEALRLPSPPPGEDANLESPHSPGLWWPSPFSASAGGPSSPSSPSSPYPASESSSATSRAAPAGSPTGPGDGNPEGLHSVNLGGDAVPAGTLAEGQPLSPQSPSPQPPSPPPPSPQSPSPQSPSPQSPSPQPPSPPPPSPQSPSPQPPSPQPSLPFPAVSSPPTSGSPPRARAAQKLSSSSTQLPRKGGSRRRRLAAAEAPGAAAPAAPADPADGLGAQRAAPSPAADGASQGEWETLGLLHVPLLGWDDVLQWLQRVLRRILLIGLVSDLLVVQEASLTVERGQLIENALDTSRRLMRNVWDAKGGGKTKLDFTEIHGKPWGFDITPQLDSLTAGDWLSPLTRSVTVRLLLRDNFGNASHVELVFEQEPTGLITAGCSVFVNLVSSFLVSVAVAGAFLLVTLCYFFLELYAFSYVNSAVRSSGGRAEHSVMAYLRRRWEVFGAVFCGLLTAVLLVGRATVARLLPETINTSNAIKFIDILDDTTRLLIVATTFFALMRALQFLTNASLFFFVVQSALKNAILEFTGVHLVVGLAVLGAAASNYLLVGVKVDAFASYGSSIFQTLSLLFGSPLLLVLPPVAALYNLIFILLWWTILLPMLIVLVVYAVRKVTVKAGHTGTEALGSEIPQQVCDCLVEFVFCCTPDPSRSATGDDALRLQQKAESAERVRREEETRKRLEERGVKVSHISDDAVTPARWLLGLLLVFAFLYVVGLCLLFDAPRIFRDHEASEQFEGRRFLSSDPFPTRKDFAASPPLWFRRDLCAAEANSTADASAPAEGSTADARPAERQHRDVEDVARAGGRGDAPTVDEVLKALSEPLYQTISLRKVTSLEGIYDWLEQVLADEILNAAYFAPYLSHRAPLANPGALLIAKRVGVQCRAPSTSMSSVWPVMRLNPKTFFSLSSEPYGVNGAQYVADPEERVYRVGLFFTPQMPGKQLPTVSGEKESGAAPWSPSASPSASPGATPRILADQSGGGGAGGGVGGADTGTSFSGPLASLLGSNRAATLNLSADEFRALYAGRTSLKKKVQSLREGGFLDYQLYSLDVVWLNLNGDSGVYILNKVTFEMSNAGGLSVKPRVIAVPAWTLSPTSPSVHASFVFIVLACGCFLAYIMYSYHATQKRVFSPSFCLFLDVPILLFLALFVFFYITMFGVSFNPGWECPASLGVGRNLNKSGFASTSRLGTGAFLSGARGDRLHSRRLADADREEAPRPTHRAPEPAAPTTRGGDPRRGQRHVFASAREQQVGNFEATAREADAVERPGGSERRPGAREEASEAETSGARGARGARGDRRHAEEARPARAVARALQRSSDDNGQALGADSRGRPPEGQSPPSSPSPSPASSVQRRSLLASLFSASSTQIRHLAARHAEAARAGEGVEEANAQGERRAQADDMGRGAQARRLASPAGIQSAWGEFGDSLDIPDIVPGPVQPWVWVPGSSQDDENSPPPTAESLTRFLRLQEALEAKGDGLFRTKIFAVLVLLMVAVRTLTLTAAVPESFQQSRKLIELLYGASAQIFFASLLVVLAFFAFCFAGYTILGVEFRGFSTPTYSVISCLMVLASRWNFNAITSAEIQRNPLTWQFEAFLFFFVIIFFCYLNYLLLAFIYLRYAQIKLDATKELQQSLVDIYGVEPRKRMALSVNDSVILYWKAFLKALQLAIGQANATGPAASLDDQAALLRDRFFDAFRGLPALANLPSTTKDRVERALVGTQLVRIQQYMTDLEFLKAKQFMILYDLKILGDYERCIHKLNKKKGIFITSLERALQDLNEEIDVVQSDIALLTYAEEQTEEGVVQRHRQKQVLELAGVAKGPAVSLQPGVYLPPESLAEAREAQREAEAAREERIEDWRRRVSEGEVAPRPLQELRKRKKRQMEVPAGSPFGQFEALFGSSESLEEEDAKPAAGAAGAPPTGVRHPRHHRSAGLLADYDDEEEERARLAAAAAQALAREKEARRERERAGRGGSSPPLRSSIAPAVGLGGPRRVSALLPRAEEEEDDDWASVRQEFGGDRQPTLHFQDDRGADVVVRPGAAGRDPRRAWGGRNAAEVEPEEEAVVRIKKTTKIVPFLRPKEGEEGEAGAPLLQEDEAEGEMAQEAEESQEEAEERPQTNAPEIRYARSMSMNLQRRVRDTGDEAELQEFTVLPRKKGDAERDRPRAADDEAKPGERPRRRGEEGRRRKDRKSRRVEDEEESNYQRLRAKSKKKKKKPERGGVFGISIFGDE
ncbi:hypothetical protein BESB_072050 [Besnoitia besnoiti]|uniref:Uncharacterized protein n=1 Tax=Besnoitia besnoiti TaxID=94643 RepID=A0A2A9MEF6_BESBE|nr:uncharacterized protein BESB_072050 [Besnoitia besnoiti]PFH34053.1 hypothetical protein BESB_072050 [Besnoitia besnoiti]